MNVYEALPSWNLTFLKAAFMLQLHVVMLRTVHMENDVCRTCVHCRARATRNVRLLKLVSLVSVSLVAGPARTAPLNMPVSTASAKVKSSLQTEHLL
jgi:hypothetical protein